MDVESLACPVSIITQESRELISRFYQQRSVHKATGGVMYGPDSSLWPARWIDAVATIQTEIDRADNAYQVAKARAIAQMGSK